MPFSIPATGAITVPLVLKNATGTIVPPPADMVFTVATSGSGVTVTVVGEGVKFSATQPVTVDCAGTATATAGTPGGISLTATLEWSLTAPIDLTPTSLAFDPTNAVASNA